MTTPRFDIGGFIVTPPSPDCAARMCAYLGPNRERFAPHGPKFPEGYFTEEFWKRRLRTYANNFALGKAVHFSIFERDDDGRIVGDANFTGIARGVLHACFLGYKIDAGFEGKGIMRRALEATIAYMFDVQNLHRIQANYLPGNERSERLLQRLGFQREGLARDYLRLDGRWKDHVMTALINPNWRAVG
jgi:ribosomal-protein-alanine N-acetyltransferase